MVNGSCRGGFGNDEDSVNSIFFACGTRRDKLEWLMALEDVVLCKTILLLSHLSFFNFSL
jgi:hypothetical protein